MAGTSWSRMWRRDTQHNDIQPNGTQHMGLFATLNINETKHNDSKHNSNEYCFVVCRYAECRYAGCRYAECRGAAEWTESRLIATHQRCRV